METKILGSSSRRVPAEAEASPKASRSHVGESSMSMRTPLPLAVGDHVKVFSSTSQKWVSGVAKEMLANDRVTVIYTDEGQICRKSLDISSTKLDIGSRCLPTLGTLKPSAKVLDFGNTDHLSCANWVGTLSMGESDPCATFSQTPPPQILNGRKVDYTLKAANVGAGVYGACHQYLGSDGKGYCIKIPHPGRDAEERSAYSVSRKTFGDQISYSKHLAPAMEQLEGWRTPDVEDGYAVVWAWAGEVPFNKFVEREGPKLTTSGKLRILDHILRGLGNLHQSGYVHGDLHGGNVMVHIYSKAEFWINLIDLGCCAKIGDRWKKHHTKPADCKYTQFAPETCTDDNYGSLRIHTSFDIWSLGMLYYRLLLSSGVDILPAPDLAREMNGLIHESRGDTKAAYEFLDKEISDKGLSTLDRTLLLKMLHPDPRKRGSSSDLFALVSWSLATAQQKGVVWRP